MEANGIEVKVYGTQFNVNTRRDDQIQTTLVEGSVSVRPKGLAEVMLKPNQQAVFNKLAGTGYGSGRGRVILRGVAARKLLFREQEYRRDTG